MTFSNQEHQQAVSTLSFIPCIFPFSILGHIFSWMLSMTLTTVQKSIRHRFSPLIFFYSSNDTEFPACNDLPLEGFTKFYQPTLMVNYGI